MLQKELLQAQEKDMIVKITSRIAHDFNNILSVILGYTSLILMDKAEDHPDYENLKQIEKAVKHANKLSEQLLLINRKKEYYKEIIDLNDKLKDIVLFLRDSLPETITTELLLENSLPFIYADPCQVKQLIVNLLMNARVAMPEGGVITISTKTIEINQNPIARKNKLGPGKYIQLTVSDNGVGMNTSIQKHIYDPFFTTKENDRGAGLDLSIVYVIVKSFGGDISFYSVPKIGTTFQIYIPIEKNLRNKSKDLNKYRKISKIYNHIGAKTILIVDDEKSIRKAAKITLESKGYTAITAENGIQALELYKELKDMIDLVIMDYHMPEMNGYECIVELLKINSNLKIIVSSDFYENKNIKRSLTSSVDYLKKPYKIETLLNKVEEVLE